MTATAVIEELQAVASEEKAKQLLRFFKTGPGQYGEGDRFLGVTVPVIRQIAKVHLSLSDIELQRLLDIEWHEGRLCALLILVTRFRAKKTTEEERKKIFRFYIKNAHCCNNWDLVDLSCREIIGEFLVDRDRSILYELAASNQLWKQRMAVVSTGAFIRRFDYTDTLNLAVQLMHHPHDLMHKAIGWMLREVGKRDQDILTHFLELYATVLPRTMLRYAIEHYPKEQRNYFLMKKKR